MVRLVMIMAPGSLCFGYHIEHRGCVMCVTLKMGSGPDLYLSLDGSFGSPVRL